MQRLFSLATTVSVRKLETAGTMTATTTMMKTIVETVMKTVMETIVETIMETIVKTVVKTIVTMTALSSLIHIVLGLGVMRNHLTRLKISHI
jgi:hypothetical protein